MGQTPPPPDQQQDIALRVLLDRPLLEQLDIAFLKLIDIALLEPPDIGTDSQLDIDLIEHRNRLPPDPIFKFLRLSHPLAINISPLSPLHSNSHFTPFLSIFDQPISNKMMDYIKKQPVLQNQYFYQILAILS